MLFNLTTISEIELSRSFNIADFFTFFESRYDRLQATVIREFGPNGIFILALFAAFITLILFIYIKSVIDTFHASDDEPETINPTSGNSFLTAELSTENTSSSSSQNDNLLEYEDTRPRITPKIAEEPQHADREAKHKAALIEKEKEISRDLIRSSETTDDILRLKAAAHSLASAAPIDWRKDSTLPENNLPTETPLHYTPEAETLDELICLIINMLGRNVKVQKIAQALYQRNQGKNRTEDLIQMVYAVRDFIALCNAGRFDNLPDRDSLPLNNEALLHWAKGDNTMCLSLLEHLIKQQIDLADSQKGMIQEMNYAQAAGYACTFGTIAATTNSELALNSFELAIELAPKNMNAWSRAGDIYWQLGNYEKSVFAYQTVLENADSILYAEQKANANRKLAQYYTRNGKTMQADELEQNSRKYYDDYGITSALTEQENAAYNLIASRRNDNLQISINQLLQNRQLQYN